MALPLTLNPESVFRSHGLDRRLLYLLRVVENLFLGPALGLHTVILEELSAYTRMTSISKMIVTIHVASRSITKIDAVMISHGLVLLITMLIEEVVPIHIYDMTIGA